MYAKVECWKLKWEFFQEQTLSPFVKLRKRSCRIFLLASSAGQRSPKLDKKKSRQPNVISASAGASMISWSRRMLVKNLRQFCCLQQRLFRKQKTNNNYTLWKVQMLSFYSPNSLERSWKKRSLSFSRMQIRHNKVYYKLLKRSRHWKLSTIF